MATKIKLEDLVMHKTSLKKSLVDCVDGRYSRTRGPVEVYPVPGEAGKLQLTDGYHRVVELLIQGGRTVETVPTPTKGKGNWAAPAKGVERFMYQPTKKFRGLEALGNEDDIQAVHDDLYESTVKSFSQFIAESAEPELSHYEVEIHHMLMFMAGKYRSSVMGAANYNYMAKLPDTAQYRTYFRKHISPLIKKYKNPDAHGSAIGPLQDEVLAMWRHEPRVV